MTFVAAIFRGSNMRLTLSSVIDGSQASSIDRVNTHTDRNVSEPPGTVSRALFC